jgi:hypothetical protein
MDKKQLAAIARIFGKAFGNNPNNSVTFFRRNENDTVTIAAGNQFAVIRATVKPIYWQAWTERVNEISPGCTDGVTLDALHEFTSGKDWLRIGKGVELSLGRISLLYSDFDRYFLPDGMTLQVDPKVMQEACATLTKMGCNAVKIEQRGAMWHLIGSYYYGAHYEEIAEIWHMGLQVSNL